MLKKTLILLSLLFMQFFASLTFAYSVSQNSKQLVVVTIPDWNSLGGSLQRYERNAITDAWHKVGKPFSVVVGKNGMAWGIDVETKSHQKNMNYKQEGDGRTPSGIYLIGPQFGFNKKIGKLDYFPLNQYSECVDDIQSAYYNQLLDRNKVSQKDWHSSEKMREISRYAMGSVIQYNTDNPNRQGGSCIFLHIWKNKNSGTTGCVAMEANNMKLLLQWLNSRKHPMLVTLVKSEYPYLKSQWDLPN